MRIIAGVKRGKLLVEKVDGTTRPTTDRVRENVFNVLANLIDINGAKVLDLFAGTGAYGLEAFSRGAAEVVLNDLDKQTFKVLKQNCELVQFQGTVLNLDFKVALEQVRAKKFDIIFLDPPYESDYIQVALEIIKQQEMLAHHGVIVIESGKQLKIPSLVFKNYGCAWLYFVNPNWQPLQ